MIARNVDEAAEWRTGNVMWISGGGGYFMLPYMERCLGVPLTQGFRSLVLQPEALPLT